MDTVLQIIGTLPRIELTVNTRQMCIILILTQNLSYSFNSQIRTSIMTHRTRSINTHIDAQLIRLTDSKSARANHITKTHRTRVITLIGFLLVTIGAHTGSLV